MNQYLKTGGAWFCVVLCCLFLFGCGDLVADIGGGEGVAEDGKRANFKGFLSPIALQDDSGMDVGFAVSLWRDQFVTVDHLLGVSGDLFHDGEKVKILSRNTARDMLVFSLPNFRDDEYQRGVHVGVAAKGMPAVWFKNDAMQTTSVGDFPLEFTVAGETKIGLIGFEGVVPVGSSGQPLFSLGGEVLGLVVGADKEKNVSFAMPLSLPRGL